MKTSLPLLEVTPIQRKSAILSRSSLACLKILPTVNLTVGCGHQCIYCYTQGYSIFPGDGKVQYYANAYEKLADELPRKRKRPTECDAQGFGGVARGCKTESRPSVPRGNREHWRSPLGTPPRTSRYAKDVRS